MSAALGDERCGCRLIEKAERGGPGATELRRSGKRLQKRWKCPRAGGRGIKRAKDMSETQSKTHARVCSLVGDKLPPGCPLLSLYSASSARVAETSWMIKNNLGAQLPVLPMALVDSLRHLDAAHGECTKAEFDVAKKTPPPRPGVTTRPQLRRRAK